MRTPYYVTALLLMVVSLFQGAAQATSPNSTQAGKIAFLRCAACHSVDGKVSNKVGPDLRGILGADAGRTQGFVYSEPLKKAAAGGLKWDAATLRRWIENPAAVIPGTSMAYANSLGSTDIDLLIGYLAAQK
jgi:cytochrome c